MLFATSVAPLFFLPSAILQFCS